MRREWLRAAESRVARGLKVAESRVAERRVARVAETSVSS